MSLPTMPRVLYAQMWRRPVERGGDGEWHPLHPLGGDDVPVVYRESRDPERADERYEIRVVRYMLEPMTLELEG
jgi:hypothetical protein